MNANRVRCRGDVMQGFTLYSLTAATILAAQAFSLAASAQDSAKDAAKLCGQRVPGRVNVVVGSFPQSGNSGDNSTKYLEAVFSGVIVGSLGSGGNINASIWDSDDRQFSNLRLQMEAL